MKNSATRADRKMLPEAEFASIREELFSVLAAERREENRALVGRYYRVRNCYSCPQTEEDYWWLYVHVTALGEDGRPIGFSFQRCSDGKVEIESQAKLFDTTIEIDEKEFRAAWRELLGALNRAYDAAWASRV